jgi:CheY-like chemotaxis protein
MSLDVQAGAERIRKIVRGLKTFGRAGEERRLVFDVHPVLELSIDMTYNEIRHRARLVKDYGKTPLVEADDARLAQVFINLLINAAQAIPEEDATANEIRILTSTDAAGSAVIEVRDTGAGIPASIIARVFDPFFTTKPIGVGTGLGLSICHNIVNAMGGAITVTSESGHGATFRVVLPAARASATQAAPVPVPPKAIAPRGTVLVVDDEASVGDVLRRVLRGHDVTAVTSAAEALARLDAGERYDVILSDLMMPAMSGMELHAEVSRRSPEVAARMVFISGGAFTPTAHAFLDRVVNERVEKPFDPQHVRDIVERYVKRRRPG